MHKYGWKLVPVALWLAGAAPAWSQTILQADASAPAAEPKHGYFHMGKAVSPKGEQLDINNLYLTRAGLPWLPVMGEFHYSRSPESSWLVELQKMKSAGVGVVASYVIWSHHEQQEGSFDWKGNRDLRRFVQLADQAGLKVVLRIGPWAHAEVRYGGMPDWVVDQMRTRCNDPVYLQHVARLYGQIAAQVKGELWKDGGPVIGVQLENEYNLDGPDQGAGHIRTLKALAQKVGLDVPLYTVTGWDGTVYPSGDVTPVFGGYPDEPWGTSTVELPPKETYAFRFGSRVSGDLGAQTTASTPGTAETDAADTPFLGAEYGAGLPAMYRRRTLLSSDDIASMLPVQLGSGVNLMGYYMFHGGRNPLGGTSLEESTLSGGYNDTPKISYDFQAPLGPDGQMRPVLAHLKPFHYFLNDFGDRLAPMMVRKPAQVPAGPADLATPRWSVRARGDAGFVFFNNHVRQYATAAQGPLQFTLKLPHEVLTFPSTPVDMPADSYFIWPYHFDLDGIDLHYATAQPLARLDAGADGIVYVFAASKGIPVEFAFPAGIAAQLHTDAQSAQSGESVSVRTIQPGLHAALTIARPGKPKLTVLVLTPEQSHQLTIGELAGRRRLVLSEQEIYFANKRIEARSPGANHFKLTVYPALPHPKAASALQLQQDGMFQSIDATVPEEHVTASVKPVRAALPVTPVVRGGAAQAAMQPSPEQFKAAAAWEITLSAHQNLDAYLQIDFTGDVGRLFSGTRLIDDWYYNGQHWQVGTDMLAQDGKPLTLTVLPLRADAPIYLPKEHRPNFAGQSQLAALDHVAVAPVYHLSISP